MSWRTLIAGCLLVAGSGCINANYSQISWHTPIPQESLQGLQQGESTLQECLDKLGAPTHVWLVDKGMAMAYGWRDQTGWGAGASVQIVQFVNASFTYTSTDANLEGVALFFDDNDKLSVIRRGKLRDIERTTRNRRSMRVRGVSVPMQ